MCKIKSSLEIYSWKTDKIPKMKSMLSKKISKTNFFALFIWAMLSHTISSQDLSDISSLASLSGLSSDIQSQFLNKNSNIGVNEIELEDNLARMSYYGEKDSSKVFGVDILRSINTTKSPIVDIPLQADYIISLNDNLELFLTGSENKMYKLRVDLSGTINVPGLGNIAVADLSLQEAQEKIYQEISKVFIGTDAFLSVVKPSLRRITVLGAVKNPGTYLVNPFTSVSEALSYAGGILENASIRTISINSKKTTKKVDLYDYLIFGDRSTDYSVMNGDTINVPYSDSFFEISGAVQREMIYEYKQGDTFQDIIAFSGGVKNDADKDNSTANILADGILSSVKLLEINGLENIYLNEVFVPKKVQVDNLNVKVFGNSVSEGYYDKNSFQTVRDLIDSLEFSFDIYPFYFELNQFDETLLKRELISFSLLDKETFKNVKIKSNASVRFFSYKDFIDLQILRDESNSSILDKVEELKELNNEKQKIKDTLNFISMQGGYQSLAQPNTEKSVTTEETEFDRTAAEVSIKKTLSQKSDMEIFLLEKLEEIESQISILSKSAYSKNEKMKFETMIYREPELYQRLVKNSITLVAGGDEYIFPLVGNYRPINLINYIETNPSSIDYEYASIVKTSNFNNDETGDKIDPKTVLTSNFGDIISFNASAKSSFLKVRIIGQVNSPGEYRISGNTSLNDLYNIAGGFSSQADQRSIVVRRESVKEIERKAVENARSIILDAVIKQIANPISTLGSTSSSLNFGSLINLLSFAESTDYLGRITGNFQYNSENATALILTDGDEIIIPAKSNLVTITGEVLSPITTTYSIDSTTKDYINLAGGYSQNADKRGIYIIKSDGTSVPFNNNLFVSQANSIQPGDTIVVPRDIEKLSGVPLVSVASKVLSDVAFAAASLNAISQ